MAEHFSYNACPCTIIIANNINSLASSSIWKHEQQCEYKIIKLQQSSSPISNIQNTAYINYVIHTFGLCLHIINLINNVFIYF